jgi:DNA (cytosine-5)-methyltransferase 1
VSTSRPLGQMTVGSLFSGIGGLDLGLERAGMRVIWQSEIDPYASRVLAKHWPDVPNFDDISLIDWGTVDRPDLVCGGFPCQPVSIAGRQRAQLDDRWLWPEFARCLRDLRPGWAVMENVPGLLAHGLGDVAADLADLGYSFEWEGIPAAAVGANHLRWRIFVVAHADGESEPAFAVDAPLAGQLVADTNCPGSQGRRVLPKRPGERAVGPGGRIEPEDRRRLDDGGGGRHRPPPEPVFAGRHVIEHPSWWSAEPDVGRVAHGIPHRVDRLRGLGNSVVPQVAEYVGRCILAAAPTMSRD